MTTVFRRFLIMMFLAFVASGLLNAGGEPIAIECPICLEEVSIQPPDPERPFVLLHGQLKHLHGVCQECAVRQYGAHGENMRCHACREPISRDMRRNIGRWDQGQWHDHNIARAARVQQHEWDEVRQLLREKEEAERAVGEAAERARQEAEEREGQRAAAQAQGDGWFGGLRRWWADDGGDGAPAADQAGVHEQDARRRLEEEIAAERQRREERERAEAAERVRQERLRREREAADAQRRFEERMRRRQQEEEARQERIRREREAEDARRRREQDRIRREAEERRQREEENRRFWEEQDRLHRENEERRAAAAERRRQEWAKLSRPCFISRHRVAIGAGVTCAAVVGFIVWRASRSNDDVSKKKQLSLVARLRARLREVIDDLRF